MSGSAFAVTHHAFSSGAGRTSDGNGSHASTLKSPSYTKSVSWQHYRKLPKGVLILEFIGMMLLAVALLSVSDSLSLPEPFSRPEVQILMIFLGVLLMLPAAVVVILQVAKRLAPQLMNRPPQYSRSEREKDNDANH